MKLPKVTKIFRFRLTGGPARAATLGAAVLLAGASAQATRPTADAPQIAIIPQQAAVEPGPQFVPPAPEPLANVALQADPPVPAVDATAATYFDAAAHGIQIIPAEISAVDINGRTYEEVYRSIPFNHTEYVANPSYRHEATMEILFGQLRPTTIVKEQHGHPIVNELPSPYQPYRYSHSERWQYHAPDFRRLDPGCYQ